MPATYPVYVDDIQITAVTGTFQSATITSTGWYSADMGTYTYTGSGTFLGFSLTSGANTPDSDLEIGDTLTPYNYIISGTIHLYSVATASNEAYLTSDIDLTSVANAIRTKGGTSASLVYPTGYVSAINALPTGALQSYKSAIFTSPGGATLTPDSGYVGIEEISVEYSPSIYDGAFHKFVVYPVKGDIIKLNMDGTDRNYRVLKISGNVAEVLAQFSAGTSAFASAGQIYAGDTLDVFLNTSWYGSCTTTAKSAIVDKTFTQDSWYDANSGNPVYVGLYGTNNTPYTISLYRSAFGNSITRHIYALSVQDIINYLGVTPNMTASNTTLTQTALNTMFNITYSNFWLCSASASYATQARSVFGSMGLAYGRTTDSRDYVIPAFQIDLSKIDWSFAS